MSATPAKASDKKDKECIFKEGEKLYKEACSRCPSDPSLFITILYLSGEIAEAHSLEFYLENIDKQS